MSNLILGDFAFDQNSEEIVYLNGLNNIGKFNLTSGTFTKYQQFPLCSGVVVHENILYIGSYMKISALNLTSGTSQLLTSTNGYGSQLAIYNEELYFYDSKIIKKMSLATKEITNVACNGFVGSTDNGYALDASCFTIKGLTVDKDGNLFFSDTYKIRKVNLATGILSVFVTMKECTLLRADDNNGYIYAVSSQNKVYQLSTVQTLVAGKDDTLFNGYSNDLSPNLVSFANTDIFSVSQTFTNDVYISVLGSYLLKITSYNPIVKIVKKGNIIGVGADPNSNDIYFGEGQFIKKLSGVDGNISIIAGIDGSVNDNIPAISILNSQIYGITTFGGDLYYTDRDYRVVRKIDSKTGFSTIVTDNASSEICFTNAGDMLIADSYGHVIRKLTKEGTLSIIAGVLNNGDYNGDDIPATQAHLFYPKGVVYSNNTNEIFITEVSRIRKISSNGTITTIAGSSDSGLNDATLAVDAKLNGAECIFLNGNDIYFCDGLNYLLRKIDEKGYISTVAGNGGDTVEDADGSKFANETSIGQVRGATIDPLTGDIFISSNYVIYRVFATSGKIITFAGKPNIEFNGENLALNEMRFSKSWGLLIKDNMLYISQGPRMVRVSLEKDDNQIVETVTGSNGDGKLAVYARVDPKSNAIIITKSGDIYFSENSRIRKISKETNVISTIIGNGASLAAYTPKLDVLATRTSVGVTSFDFADNGNIYFIELHTVKMIDNQGFVRLVAGSPTADFTGDDGPAINATFSTPLGIAVISNDILIADTGNNRIRKINLKSNIISTIAGNGNTDYAPSENITSLFNPKYLTRSKGEIYYTIPFETGSIINKLVPYCTQANYVVDGLNCVPTCFGSKTGCAFGNCIEVDTCECQSGYYGLKCDNFNCSNISFNSPSVCSRNGMCISPNNCSCNEYHNGTNCEIFDCFGISNNNFTYVCSGKGSCLSHEYCSCNNGYYGSNCDQFNCSNISFNSPNVCSNNGICTAPNNCSCNFGYFGSNCEIYDCFGTSSKNSSVCSEKGTCLGYNSCSCQYGYYGLQCEMFNCSSIPFNSPNVCSRKGECISSNNCSCNIGYYGSNCEMFDCYGISSTYLTSVCSANGVCNSPNNCSCNEGYYGNNCELFNCSSIPFNSPNVCSRNGTCSAPNNCSCSLGYYGSNCELFDCFGISNLKVSSCSGNGLCLGYNSCSCVPGYSGKECEISPKVSQSTKVSTSFKLSHANTLTSHPLFIISIFLLLLIIQ